MFMYIHIYIHMYMCLNIYTTCVHINTNTHIEMNKACHVVMSPAVRELVHLLDMTQLCESVCVCVCVYT